MVTECRHWRLFLIGLITRSHSILSFGIEPGFIPYHNIALIGTLFSEYYIIPSCFAILVQD
jgi:hypothetical protein